MSNFKQWQSGTALGLLVSVAAGVTAPIAFYAPAFAQTSFSDVPANYWARGFIQELAARNIIKGFPDGSFRPNEPVTRAQFAAMVSNAFNQAQTRNPTNFVDVPANFWAANAIRSASTMGFMAGYPGQVFAPAQNIPRVQVLVSLANGLNYTAATPADTLLPQYYTDASAIPSYARPSIAAATERRIVVNYPSVQVLNPNQTATRADVAAFVYQALSSAGQVTTALASPYIVGSPVARPPAPQPPAQGQAVIPSGYMIAVKYDKEKILVGREETAPITLSVAQNIATAQGSVLIPANSQIVGELRPTQGGSQFVARELVLPNGQRLALNATSQVVTKTEEINKGTSAGKVIQNAALGAAAAAAISAVTGDRAIATEEVLGGAGVAALLGLFLGQDKATLISINPNTDLNLRVNSNLVVR
ncbi:MAG: S-layer homology domain-containing protein [Leptolyngbyaceae bacterium]|nr:S-layer homology domain-containing protein [Leptolyngbyaceae bacterium]